MVVLPQVLQPNLDTTLEQCRKRGYNVEISVDQTHCKVYALVEHIKEVGTFKIATHQLEIALSATRHKVLHESGHHLWMVSFTDEFFK